jgi:2-polyprenyl-3-methyl-5-hydroxy-6-metoxy-1,4-benzoquinol methylase
MRRRILSRSLLLSPADEKARYDTHNNDVEDPGYQKFVSPVVEAVVDSFAADSTGLDFGAGPGPVVSKLLAEQGYLIRQYDPFYSPDESLLKESYDYIVCCEVIEHFNDPQRSFALLRRLLRPGAKLFCMTLLYSPAINIDKWFYANDETHTFFFQAHTLNWIKKHFAFSALSIDNRLVKFTG